MTTSVTDAGLWVWPEHEPVIDLSLFYILTYPKQGLSRIDAARLLGEGPEVWSNRKSAPIQYLLKYGQHGVAERIYYRLARALNLPHQSVFWAIHPDFPDLVAVAIKFEADAFRPKRIDPDASTVTYRRRVTPVLNGTDFYRHHVLQTFLGSGDHTQMMVKQNILFGIDAADCTPSSWRSEGFWQRFAEWFTDKSKSEQVAATVMEMMGSLARQADIPAWIEQELQAAPNAIVRSMSSRYVDAVQTMQEALREFLEDEDQSVTP